MCCMTFAWIRLYIETIRLNRLRWFGHVQRMEENIIPKRVLYMNLGRTRLRGRPRNRWQDEVRENGRIVNGEGWQEKVHDREEWKKLLRMARNRRNLHVPTEWMNERFYIHTYVRTYIHTYMHMWSHGNITITFLLDKMIMLNCRKWDLLIFSKHCYFLGFV
jgi:hypothetical protein